MVNHPQDKQVRCREAIWGLGFFLVAPSGAQPLTAGGGSIPGAPHQSWELGVPTVLAAPNINRTAPKAPPRCKGIATALLLPQAPCPQCVHQLFLEIETSTCHLRKSATYRGLIKSSKWLGNLNMQKSINVVHKTMQLLLAKVYRAIK